jgi:hypothetical protein
MTDTVTRLRAILFEVRIFAEQHPTFSHQKSYNECSTQECIDGVKAAFEELGRHHDTATMRIKLLEVLNVLGLDGGPNP